MIKSDSLPLDAPAVSHRALTVLYITLCFCSGAAMMVIELAGIRLLSPMFGNSLYTWTALIGVVLIAFSVGGYLGGWLADRTISARCLGTLLFFAAVSTLMVGPIHAVSAASIDSLGLVTGPTVFSLILFTIPGCFLGAVSPYATRLLAYLSGDTRIGFAAGAANMAGALGSFIGTFASGFVLIPLFDIRSIFAGVTALLLMLCVIVYRCAGEWPAKDRMVLSLAAIAAAFLLFVGVRTGFAEGIIDSRMSFYQQILIVEEHNDKGETIRRMYNDRAQQGALNLDTNQSPLPYQHYWQLSRAYLPSVERALVIGGGTFGIPKDLSQAWPAVKVIALEIDPAVVELAKKHFLLSDFGRVVTIAEDARFYLNRTTEPFDLIFGDAYAAEHMIPAHLTTREFFRQIKQRLTPGGVYMMNIIGSLDGPSAEVFAAVHTTLRTVFPSTHVYRAYDRPDDELNNLIVVASDSLVEPVVDSEQSELATLLQTRVDPDRLPISGTLLTDHHNALELLVARALASR